MKKKAILGIICALMCSISLMTSCSILLKGKNTSMESDGSTAQFSDNSSLEEKVSSVEESCDSTQKEEYFMINPIPVAVVSNGFGFYYNKTLNCYYEHVGIDFSAEVGTEIFAAADGIVESIYTGDIMLGTELTIDHGNGIKTLYRFVNILETITAGMEVKQGALIATVAEANGNEYRDGSHLHFEVHKNGVSVDPVSYIPLE